MHASTAFVALVVVASAIPSLSVPLYTRDTELVFSRNVPTAPGSADQSGAFSFGKLLKGAAKLIFREDGEMLSRREVEDILARAVPPSAGPTDQSGAFSFGKLLKGAAKLIFREDGEMLSRREIEDLMSRDDFEELLARAAPAEPAGADQQSGAFNFGNLIKGAAHAFFGREDGLMTRDFDEFFARDDGLVARDEFVARDDELFSREDFEDLLARAAPPAADQSGAFNLGKILKGAASLIFRDDHELLSRRELEHALAQAAPADQSGAFSFGNLIKGAAHAFFGREEGELMARDLFDEELFARDDDLFARDDDLFAREDDIFARDDDLFARDDDLFAREDELMARDDFEDFFARDVAAAPHVPAGAPNDQSGGLFLGKIIRGVGHALFGREEDLYARDDFFDLEARSLNELD